MPSEINNNSGDVVRTTYQWDTFMQPLLLWKSNKYDIFWVYAVAIGTQHAMRIRHIVTCDLPGSTILFYIIS